MDEHVQGGTSSIEVCCNLAPRLVCLSPWPSVHLGASCWHPQPCGVSLVPLARNGQRVVCIAELQVIKAKALDYFSWACRKRCNSIATQPASAAGCSRASRVAWPTTRLSSLRPISFRREGMGLSWQGRGTETEGLIPEREPEKRLSHPRKAAGAQRTQTRQRKVVRRINNTEHPCHVTGLERVEVKGAMGCCKAAALVGLRGR